MTSARTRSFLVTSLVSNCFTAMSSPEFKFRPRNTVPKALRCACVCLHVSVKVKMHVPCRYT